MKKIISVFLIITLIFSYACGLNVFAVSGQDIVNEALKWLEANSPYGPSDGSGGYGSMVDCSGLVMQVYKKFGFSLGRTTYEQGMAGVYVDKLSMQPGDIVCMSYPDGSTGHVGIYVGNDRMIHSPGKGRYVQYGNNISWWDYENGGCKLVCGRRLIGTDIGYETLKPYISDTSRLLKKEELSETYDANVLELQKSLNYLMGAGLVEDGLYGEKTYNAVKNFQMDYWLEVDGVAGPQTLDAINGAIGAKPSEKILTFKIGDANMYINGVAREIDPGGYATPIVENGTVLLPVRVVAEMFGAEVYWDGANNKVTIYADGIEMQFLIYSNEATVNGIAYSLDAASWMIDGKTYVPIRFIAENLGLNVVWNGDSQAITIRR